MKAGPDLTPWENWGQAKMSSDPKTRPQDPRPKKTPDQRTSRGLKGSLVGDLVVDHYVVRPEE